MTCDGAKDGGSGNPLNDATEQEIDDAFMKMWLEDPGFRQRSIARLADMANAKPGDVLVGITVTQGMIDEAAKKLPFYVLCAEYLDKGPIGTH